MSENKCPLCASDSQLFHNSEKHRFFSCDSCQGIFRDPRQVLGPQLEKDRYLLHQNHMQDLGYRNFVAPILEAVRSNFKAGASGLDYGCGHTPVISELLKLEEYKVDAYDPFFFPDRSFEDKSYDFIVCCEVMEHFQNPKKEFELLSKLLKADGKLICMTSLFSESTDFESWYYKNDPTHVFLYRKETLDFLVKTCNFGDVKIRERLIVFSK